MQPRIDNFTLSLIISGRLQDVDWDSLSPEDWDLLVARAQAEGAGPLVYWTLSRSGKFSFLPESARNSLRAMYSNTWIHNQKIFKELEVLARLFHQAEIPVVVLKGACFALTIYPDIGLRPMQDMDLLIPAFKISQAVQIATSYGYERIRERPEIFIGERELFNQEITLGKMDGLFLYLDLHKNLIANQIYTYAVHKDWFWNQIESFSVKPFFGSLMPEFRFQHLGMLTPMAQLLHSAAHAILQHGDRNSPLLWFYDLDRLLRVYAERMDWDLLIDRAMEFQWGSVLYDAFSQTHSYFNTPIPDFVYSKLSKQSDGYKNLIVLKKNNPETLLIDEGQELMALKGWVRFRLALVLIAPAPAYMRWRYQFKTSWKLPVYYLLRWWRIFEDAVRTVIVLLRRSPETKP
jgi:hypothetical protein